MVQSEAALAGSLQHLFRQKQVQGARDIFFSDNMMRNGTDHMHGNEADFKSDNPLHDGDGESPGQLELSERPTGNSNVGKASHRLSSSVSRSSADDLSETPLERVEHFDETKPSKVYDSAVALNQLKNSRSFPCRPPFQAND